MNYSNYRSSKNRKRISAFYIILAVCLLAVGAATWYSAHSVRPITGEHDSGSAPQSSEAPPVSSDTENSEVVGNAVKDEPYPASSVPTESAPPPKEAEPVAFAFPLQGEIIKPYSDTQLQYSATYGDMRLHRGMDISCEEGTAVSVTASGSVTAVEESAELGTVVTVNHGNGLVTRYACIKDAKVSAGDKVASGDIIGTVGEIPCECADQTHLHFEVLKNGYSADPSLLFKTE